MKQGSVVSPERAQLVVESELADTTVLLHLGDRRLHVLNDTAGAIWDELGRASTVGEIAAGLGERFDVEPGTIRRDVERMLEQFEADRLVGRNDGASPVLDRRPNWPVPGSVTIPAKGSYQALSARVGVVCADSEIVEILARIFSTLVCSDSPTVELRIETLSETSWSVAVGSEPAAIVGSRLAVVLRTIGEMNNIAVSSAPDDLIFHAGAVTDGDGVALLPAASNHGKSTLTAALVQAGFGYLTDEAAAVSEGQRVRPYAKSVALDPGSFALFGEFAPQEKDGLARALNCREWHIDPAQLGNVGESGEVKVVVCPHWRAGATTRLHRHHPTEALHELLGQSFDFSAGGQAVFDRLVRLVETVPVYRLGYSDLAEAVAVVGDLLKNPESAL